MDTLIKTIEKNGLVVECHFNLNPPNFRNELDNDCKFILFDNKYLYTPNDTDFEMFQDVYVDKKDFVDYNEFFNQMIDIYQPYIINSLYGIKDGLQMSLTNFISVESELIGCVLINEETSSVTEYDDNYGMEQINSEIEMYNDFLAGNVYLFKVYKDGVLKNEYTNFWGGNVDEYFEIVFKWDE